MDLYLQHGWQMRPLANDMLDDWNGGISILSPRDMTETVLIKVARDSKKRNGLLLIDPQLYEPHSNHFRLAEHGYWPTEAATKALTDADESARLMTALFELNDRAGTQSIILPGYFAQEISET